MIRALCLFLCGTLATTAATAPPTQIVFEHAVEALARADYPAAEQGFREVLRREPNNAEAIANLAILYARSNRNDKAIHEYERALRYQPRNAAILLDLGLIYLKEEFQAKALEYFDRVLAIDPANPQARPLADLCRLYTGDAASALADLQQLAAARPGDEQILSLLGFAYLKAGNSDSAKETFDRMLKSAGPARAQFLLAKAAYEAALFPQAEASFLEVRKLDPQFPGLHLELGKLYISERRTPEAIAELKAALAGPQDNQEASYFLGSLLVRENRAAEGIPYLEKARAEMADSYGVNLYLGKAYSQLGKSHSAVRFLEKAAELSPDDPAAQYALARALKKDGQEAAARDLFNRLRNFHSEAAESTIPGAR